MKLWGDHFITCREWELCCLWRLIKHPHCLDVSLDMNLIWSWLRSRSYDSQSVRVTDWRMQPLSVAMVLTSINNSFGMGPPPTPQDAGPSSSKGSAWVHSLLWCVNEFENACHTWLYYQVSLRLSAKLAVLVCPTRLQLNVHKSHIKVQITIKEGGGCLVARWVYSSGLIQLSWNLMAFL